MTMPSIDIVKRGDPSVREIDKNVKNKLAFFSIEIAFSSFFLMLQHCRCISKLA